ncbi:MULTISPECIES: hypothetical protein [unclassified Streptomyces]|uniref:hypothetical protein n=1 Tax=unclassified Streptomyces TaxID=2593676 RepID=UPI000378A349|nr:MULTISPECIES: hypothetical protein [unclassified Streptomyces]MYT32076.1 hypothetical protein [Streptomyces sp. SID8354]
MSPPPASAEDALALVRSRFAEPKLADGSPAPLHVHEFDTGYLVYPWFSESTDAAGPPRPAPPCGSKVVVVKATGETVTVPNLPTESAIALFRRQWEAQA